jgi:thiol-disulfide isomerase/thioredoxin
MNFVVVALFLVIVLVMGFFAYRALNPGETATNSDAARLLVGDGDNKVTFLKDLNGAQVDLSQYAGKVRVVNVWATWSPFSKDELSLLNSETSKYADDVVFVAINRAEPVAKVQAYVNKLKQMDGTIFLLDENDKFYDSLDGFAMPETIFYDRKGKMIFHKRGSLTAEETKKYIEEALNSEPK